MLDTNERYWNGLKLIIYPILEKNIGLNHKNIEKSWSPGDFRCWISGTDQTFYQTWNWIENNTQPIYEASFREIFLDEINKRPIKLEINFN